MVCEAQTSSRVLAPKISSFSVLDNPRVKTPTRLTRAPSSSYSVVRDRPIAFTILRPPEAIEAVSLRIPSAIGHIRPKQCTMTPVAERMPTSFHAQLTMALAARHRSRAAASSCRVAAASLLHES